MMLRAACERLGPGRPRPPRFAARSGHEQQQHHGDDEDEEDEVEPLSVAVGEEGADAGSAGHHHQADGGDPDEEPREAGGQHPEMAVLEQEPEGEDEGDGRAHCRVPGNQAVGGGDEQQRDGGEPGRAQPATDATGQPAEGQAGDDGLRRRQRMDAEGQPLVDGTAAGEVPERRRRPR